MRDVATTLIEILGAVLVVAGVSMISVPVGMICAGICLIIGSYLAATR